MSKDSKDPNMDEPSDIKTKALFGLSAIPDQMTYQAFQIWIFTYYFTVVIRDVTLIWIAFIIWAIWNAINDPLLGALSDRTKSKGKWGKRKFYLVISIFPLCLMMILLFTVSLTASITMKFIYFLAVILIFEFVYTLWDVNCNALFPEMFPNEEERAKTNLFIKGFTVVGIMIAFILPTIIAEVINSPLVPLKETSEEFANSQSVYIITGILLAIITIVAAILFILYGVKEREEYIEDFEIRPSFSNSLKLTLKNKTFVKFVIANTMIWFVFSILTTILPLYGAFVLGTGDDPLLLGLALGLAFIVAILCFPLHIKIGSKIGMRNGLMLTLVVWICTLFPYILLDPNESHVMLGIFITAIQGFALAGAMFYVDILIGDVIDQDELQTGVKRSASYYGINAFIHRLSTILVISTIAIVFTGTGWSEYNARADVNTVIGLKMLIFLFPAIALIVAILFLKWFDLHGEKLMKMREELSAKKQVDN